MSNTINTNAPKVQVPQKLGAAQPLKSGPAAMSGVQRELALNQVFEGQRLTESAPIATAPVAQQGASAVQASALGHFESLTQFLSVKPQVKPMAPFAPAQAPATPAEARATLRQAAQHSGGLGRSAKDLVMLDEAKIPTLSDLQSRCGVPAFATPGSPQNKAMQRTAEQVARASATGAAAKEFGLTTEAQEVVQKNLPAIMGGIDFANGDIEAIAMMLMMQISQDAEHDLRDICEDMNKGLKAKRSLTALKQKMLEDNIALKNHAQDDYATLPEDYKSKVSFDEFWAQRDIIVYEPQLNSATGEYTYKTPELVPVDQPFLDSTSAGKTSATPIGSGSTASDPLPSAINDTFFDPAVLSLFYPSKSDSVWMPGLFFEVESKPAKKEQSGNAQSTSAASDPANHGKMTSGEHLAESTNQGIEAKIDSQSELNEQVQLRLQILTDRRKQAAETLSNLMKKFSDTKDAIIKNTGG